jgi:hypothetical protein
MKQTCGQFKSATKGLRPKASDLSVTDLTLDYDPLIIADLRLNRLFRMTGNRPQFLNYKISLSPRTKESAGGERIPAQVTGARARTTSVRNSRVNRRVNHTQNLVLNEMHLHSRVTRLDRSDGKAGSGVFAIELHCHFFVDAYELGFIPCASSQNSAHSDRSILPIENREKS